jgi:zinc transport system ATP-binding protein
MSNIISIKNVSKSFNNNLVLDTISMNVRENDFIGVIGPNGGGKTTLIRLILGLITPDKGEITMQTNLINAIGYLPQKNNFDISYPITIQDVVLSGFVKDKFRTHISRKQKSQAQELLEKFELSEFANRTIAEVSGGQLQKALLARAVVSKPKLLILDEPDTYIDSSFEHEMYEILQELNKELAILLVSHDMGMISGNVKAIACINKKLHYHADGKVCGTAMEMYGCSVDILAHQNVNKRILNSHS